MMGKVAVRALLALALVSAVTGQGAYNPNKGQPILVRPGQLAKLTWKPSPPHPDVVMCCGGALQLSWSPMDGGVVSSVVAYTDSTCPTTLQNQENVNYIFQAAPKGIVTLDMKQNGDYYISCSVGRHCEDQGMQFLLAVRGCQQDNPIYTPTTPINVQCQQGLGQGGLSQAVAGVVNGTMGQGVMSATGAPATAAAARQARSSSAGIGKAAGLMSAAMAGAAAAVAALL